MSCVYECVTTGVLLVTVLLKIQAVLFIIKFLGGIYSAVC